MLEWDPQVLFQWCLCLSSFLFPSFFSSSFLQQSRKEEKESHSQQCFTFKKKKKTNIFNSIFYLSFVYSSAGAGSTEKTPSPEMPKAKTRSHTSWLRSHTVAIPAWGRGGSFSSRATPNLVYSVICYAAGSQTPLWRGRWWETLFHLALAVSKASCLQPGGGGHFQRDRPNINITTREDT